MSVSCSGFFWTASTKETDKNKFEWLPATLELSPSVDVLHITVHPSDPIYEAVDEEERKIDYPLGVYKKCLKFAPTSASGETNEMVAAPVTSAPVYQLVLQKRLLLKGTQLKIGFDNVVSLQLFHDKIKRNLKASRKKHERGRQRLHRLKEKSIKKRNFDEIADFMTENEIYETNTTGTIKVNIVATDLSAQLKIQGTYLLEIKDLEVILMDYITLEQIYTWHFKTVRSFGYNHGKLYILTGSKSCGGCGLLIFESSKGDLLMSHLLSLMRKVAAEHDPRSTSSVAVPSDITPPHSKTLSLDSHQDVSSSLQDFCRSHCCNLNLATRKAKRASEGDKGVAEYDRTADDDNDVSLGEMEAANASATDGDLSSLEAEFSQRLSLTEDARTNEERLDKVDLEQQQQQQQQPAVKENSVVESKPPVKKNEKNMDRAVSSKESRKHGFRAQSLKRVIHDFFGHPSSMLEETHRQASSLTVLDSSTSLNNAPQPSNAPKALAAERKAQSFNGNQSTEEGNPLDTRSAIPKHSASTKAVQLIKWRDLSRKNEITSSQNYLISPSSTDSDSSESEAGSCYRGSDIVKFLVKQQQHQQQVEEEDETREEAEVMTRSGEVKERRGSNSPSIKSAPAMKRPVSAFHSELVASTAF